MIEPTLRKHLHDLCHAYADGTGYKPSYAIRLAVDDGSFYSEVITGPKSFTVRRYDKAVKWFSDNWPDTADWPPSVPRPANPPRAKKAVRNPKARIAA